MNFNKDYLIGKMFNNRLKFYTSPSERRIRRRLSVAASSNCECSLSLSLHVGPKLVYHDNHPEIMTTLPMLVDLWLVFNTLSRF